MGIASTITKYKKTSILLLLIILYVGYKLVFNTKPLLQVDVANASNTTITETVDVTGKIYPSDETKITAELGALVLQVYAQDGDTVTKGKLLALLQIDATSISNAKTTNPMAQAQKAMQGGMLNPATIAQAMQQVQQPTTQPTIKKIIKEVSLYAPAAGVLTDCILKKGERLNTSIVASIYTPNKWELRTTVNEVEVLKLKNSNIATVKIDAIPNAELLGQVYKISNNSSTTNALTGGLVQETTSYKVYIKLLRKVANKESDTNTTINYALRTGMNATVKINVATKANVITVPINAVTTRYTDTANKSDAPKAQTVVFTISNNNIVTQQQVNVGLQSMQNIEILSGVKVTDKVIIAPFDAIDKTLTNGQKVKINAKKN